MLLRKIRRSARQATRGAGLVGWTVLLNSGVKLPQALAAGEAKQRVYNRWQRLWARGMLRLFGIRVEAQPPPPPPPARGGRLVVCSHRSVTDIPILLGYFHGSILARADIDGWPVLGKAARDAGCIFVERDEKTSRSNAVQVIRQRLAEGGTVLLFPEGTVSPGDELLPFRRGAFAAACELGVEIIPAAIAYPDDAQWTEESFLTHLANVAARPAIDVVLLVGEGRRATGSADEVTEAVQATVQGLLREAQAMRRQRARR